MRTMTFVVLALLTSVSPAPAQNPRVHRRLDVRQRARVDTMLQRWGWSFPLCVVSSRRPYRITCTNTATLASFRPAARQAIVRTVTRVVQGNAEKVGALLTTPGRLDLVWSRLTALDVLQCPQLNDPRGRNDMVVAGDLLAALSQNGQGIEDLKGKCGAEVTEPETDEDSATLATVMQGVGRLSNASDEYFTDFSGVYNDCIGSVVGKPGDQAPYRSDMTSAEYNRYVSDLQRRFNGQTEVFLTNWQVTATDKYVALGALAAAVEVAGVICNATAPCKAAASVVTVVRTVVAAVGGAYVADKLEEASEEAAPEEEQGNAPTPPPSGSGQRAPDCIDEVGCNNIPGAEGCAFKARAIATRNELLRRRAADGVDRCTIQAMASELPDFNCPTGGRTLSEAEAEELTAQLCREEEQRRTGEPGEHTTSSCRLRQPRWPRPVLWDRSVCGDPRAMCHPDRGAAGPSLPLGPPVGGPPLR